MSNLIQNIPISKIETNNGQINGLPKNPRYIKDDRFAALVKSIRDAPEMLHLRELIVYEHGEKYVVVGGNMRLLACRELGYEEIPCKVLSSDTPIEKLREYAIKDNVAFGLMDWDIISNEWDECELEDWGLETPLNWENEDDEEVNANTGDDIENGTYEKKIKVGKYDIPLTDEEFEMLTEKIKVYMNMYQNTYGFIKWLINGDNTTGHN